jgi:nucleoside-diphosphate-sugar epimerase
VLVLQLKGLMFRSRSGLVAVAFLFQLSYKTEKMKISITGGAGYIGKHLIAEIKRSTESQVKVLSRSPQQDLSAVGFGAGVEIIEGDLRNPSSLKGFFEPDCIVVNLVYLWGAGEAENLAVTRNLLDACKAARVKRLIHCSTAAVVGRIPDDCITEDTSCQPVTEYGITKLKVEEAVIQAAPGFFDAVILRPTSIFGPGGEAVKKLAGDLTTGNRLRNYLKSCLFGHRKMNLVHISNVVASILFLMQRNENFGGEIFIVSDDDSPINNFVDIERFLIGEFGIPDYSLPRLPMPPGLLRFLLICLGRNNVNPCCYYVQDKLMSLGFKSPVSFERGLTEYANWYRSSHFDGRREKVG